MNEQFRAKLNAKLAAYREWSSSREIGECKLVQYCGIKRLLTVSLRKDEVERQIEGLLREGFYVDWAEHESKCFLRVWEFGGPEPEWAKVFAE